MTDHEIIALYEARDETAISESERVYGHYCHTIAMNILNSPPDAEECVNDTWLKTWNSIPPAKPGSLRLWFARLVRQLSLNRLRDSRAAKRDSRMTVALDELADVLSDEGANDDGQALADVLNEFLVSLDDTERRLFLGRYWYGATPAELGGTWGLSRNAVEHRLLRTREKLRTFLTERGYRI